MAEKEGYEEWARQRLMNKARCAVEPSMSCIPLRGDPICSACYQSGAEAGKVAVAQKGCKGRAVEDQRPLVEPIG